jgi:hypothetical protein
MAARSTIAGTIVRTGPELKAEYSSQTASSISALERPGNLQASVLITDTTACCSSLHSIVHLIIEPLPQLE